MGLDNYLREHMDTEHRNSVFISKDNIIYLYTFKQVLSQAQEYVGYWTLLPEL